ncbi:hypothetical protein [Dolichospermum phage Dfl-JY45]
MIQWIDLSAHGFQLRGAQREGESRRVVAVPDPIEADLSASVVEGLTGLGFERSGWPAVWHREARGLLMAQVLGRFPQGVLSPIAVEELFTAPYPDGRDGSPLGRLAELLSEQRSAPNDMLGTGTALVQFLAAAHRESGEIIWARWADVETIETLAAADAQSIARWMEGQLRMRAVRTSDDPVRDVADPVLATPELRGRSGFELRRALEEWKQHVEAPLLRTLDIDEARIRDVEALLGETPRVELARHCVGASRRAVALERGRLEAAEKRASDAEFEAVVAEWGPYVSPNEGADVRGLMIEAGLDPEGLAVALEDGELRALRPADSGAVAFFGRASEMLGWTVTSTASLPMSIVTASREVAARVVARRDAAANVGPVVLLQQAGGKVLALDERFVRLIEAMAPGGTWRGPDRTEQEHAVAWGGGGVAYERDGALVAMLAPLRHIVAQCDRQLPEILARAAAGFPDRARPAAALAADGAVYRGAPLGAPPAARVDLDVSAWLPPTVQSGASTFVTVMYVGVPADVAQRAESAHDAGVSVPWAEIESLSYGRVLRDVEDGHPVPFAGEVLPDRVVVGWRRSDLQTTLNQLRNRRAYPDTTWFLEAAPGAAPVLEVHVPFVRERASTYKERVIIPAHEDQSLIILRRPVDAETWSSAGVFEPVPARGLADDALERGLVRVAHADDPAIAQAVSAWEAQRSAEDLDAELVSPDDSSVASEADGPDSDADDEAEESRPPEGKARIEDFGEKIGGARKDINGLGSRALEVAMTETWTSDELREYLTKDRLWPFSVKQRLAEGAEPGVVALEKDVRDYVRPEYHRVGRGTRGNVLAWDDAAARRWASGVRVMASVFEGVKTVAELKARASAAFDAANPVARARLALTEGVNLRRYRDYWRNWVGGLAAQDESVRFRVVGQIEASGRVLMARRERNENRRDVREQVKLARPEKGKAPRISERPHLAEIGRVGPEVRSGNVTPELLATTFGFRGGEFGNWLGQKERQEVLNFAFESLHDLARVLGIPASAVSLNGELAIAFGARGTGGKRSAAAHYETGRRVINLTRMNGAGSLAHEFAHAFDHYVARTLAPDLGRVFVTESGGDVTGYRLRGSGLREEVARAIAGVVQSLFWYRPSDEERVAASRSEAVAAMDEIQRLWQLPLAHPEKALAWQVFGGNDAIVLADTRVAAGVQAVNLAFMRLCDELREGLATLEKARAMLDDAPTAAGELVAEAGQRVYEAQRAITAAWDENRKEPNEALRQIAPHLRLQCAGGYASSAADRVQRRINEWQALIVRLATGSITSEYQTQYLRDALAIDEFEQRKPAYWAQPIELFARAFESWVFDRLQEKGQHSDYLVHGVEDKGYTLAEHGAAVNAGDVRDPESGRGLFPYPRGVERARINAAFDALAGALKHEVTPEGHCKLYQRRPSPLGAGQGMSVEAVVRAVHRFRDALANTCGVEVVAQVEDLPAPAPADVAGLFDVPTRTVYLVAANLRSPGEVNATLTHEILRHAGLFALLGEHKESVLESIWADNPSVRQRADALRSEGIEEGIVFSRTEATEEALAQLADEGALVRLSTWGRAAAWIRSAIRDVGLGSLVGRWDDRDVAYLVSRAARASGLRPHTLPTAGSATPDGWMMRFLEAPRRALTAGAFLGSMLGAGVLSGLQPAPPRSDPYQPPLSWPEIYAPECVADSAAREDTARRWARFGMPAEAFSAEVRSGLMSDIERARAALEGEADRIHARFDAVEEALMKRVESGDPLVARAARVQLESARSARDEAYSAASSQVFGNVDAQVLAALNAQCREIADAYAPPVRWPDPREMEALEDESAAASVRSPSL